MKKAIGFFSIVLFAVVSYAHGDLSARIKQKTIEILEHPKKSSLYFERGYLYQQHLEFDFAISDYKSAEELGYSENLINYRKSEVYLNVKSYNKALKAVDEYLKRADLDIKGKKLKAQVLIKLKNYKKALKPYTFVIQNTIDLRPADIIEYSELFLLENHKNYKDAIKAITIGLEKLGNDVITLRFKKLEYLKKSKQFKKAIQEYDSLISKTKRKEFLYYEKATYLAESNKKKETLFALKSARNSIFFLPLKIKNTIAIKELIVQINKLEKKLQS